MKAVFFDAFGTLCDIGDKRSPYRPILKAWPGGTAEAYQRLTTTDSSPADLARQAGCDPDTSGQVEEGVAAEIKSLFLYPEVGSVLERLRSQGIKWAVVSNLAAPYNTPVLNLLSFPPDVWAGSNAVGFRKPQAEIYLYACNALGVEPPEVLMVGDSLEDDYKAPKGLGLAARYLHRDGNPEGREDWIKDLTGIFG